MSQERWPKLDKGQFEIKEMQCENCLYKMKNPMICKKFPDRKPSFVLKVEADCIEYQKENA